MKKFLFIIIILCTNILIAQDHETFCTTPSTSSHIEELDAIRGLDHSNDHFYIKIHVHVLRKEVEPKLGQSREDVNRQIQYLYDVFDPMGIHFVWNDWIDYIDNDQFFSNTVDYTSEIFNTNSHSDGIDIYFFDILGGGTQTGWGLADDIGGSALIVGGAFKSHTTNAEDIHMPYSWTNVVVHEMGHVLFLFHTHHGTWVQEHAGCQHESGPLTCPELVDGSNGQICGDYIQDTPADPCIQWKVDTETCEFLPPLDPNDCQPDMDANRDLFQPDTNNLMSYTHPTCLETFSFGQLQRMKNAIAFLPVLQNHLITDYTYIRPMDDCFVCENQDFYVYSTRDLNYLYPISSANVSTQVIEQTDSYLKIRVTNNDSGSLEGQRGDFSIVASGKGMIVAKQTIWVGVPQAVPDYELNGPDEVEAGENISYSILDGMYRLEGINTYNWVFPEPNESFVFWGGPPPNNPTIWEYNYISKYNPSSGNSAGNDTGIVTVRGENSCGLGFEGINNEICVNNLDDNDGEPDCSNTIGGILYYPNAADDLLTIDLSLQEYDIFTVTIYDSQQLIIYTGLSENLIKTIDTVNMSNGMYYLHIYNSSNNLLLNEILVINH